tara:strand:- start:1283 stop:2200 length:918 start_codon:yes stop_codon:yes gene_type:complete
MVKDKISVIMSVKDETKYLKSAIQSILTQTYGKFEFLIVNDYSSREVQKILQFFKKKDKRIKVINNKKNLGLTKSLIKAIKKASGEYIARLDSDDFSVKNRLQTQIEWFKKSSKRVLCGTNYFLINKKNAIKKKNVICGEKKIRKSIIYQNCFIHSSAMFRHSVYKKVGGYNPNFKYSQDYELWSKLINQGEIDNIKKRLTYLRDHKKSISYLKNIDQVMYGIIVSCNNFHFSKQKRFFKVKKKIQENINLIENKLFLRDFYNCILFLNRKKIEKKYYLKLSKLSYKSLLYCIKQPKAFVYNLFF